MRSVTWRKMILHVGLVSGALITLMPLAWMIAASFMHPGEANRMPPPLLPSQPTLENYRQFFTDSKWTDALWITAARTVVGASRLCML